MARHAQIAQNNKFVISLQHILKKWVAKLIFHMQISMKVSWKLIVLVLTEMVKDSQSSQNSKFATSLQYLNKKKKLDDADFCLQINIKVFYKLISTLWAFSCKELASLLMDMTKHSQSTKSNKFAISLQYLKKKLGMEFIFYKQINIKVSTRWHYRFWWKWPDMSKVPEIRS